MFKMYFTSVFAEVISGLVFFSISFFTKLYHYQEDGRSRNHAENQLKLIIVIDVRLGSSTYPSTNISDLY